MKTIERSALVVGLLLFVWLLRRIGVATVLQTVGRIGWGFAAVVALYGITAVLNTLAWRLTLAPANRVRLGLLFGFLLSGDAINAVTPSAVVGGELVRFALLRRRVAGAPAAASVALAAGLQFLAQILFVLAGLPLVVRQILGGTMRTGFLLLFGAVTAICAVALFLAARGDVFQRLHRLARRFSSRGRWLDATESASRSLDEAIFGAIRERRVDLLLALALFLAGWITGIVEIGLILFFLGTPLGWRACASVEVLSVVVDTVFFFVPARLGTQEGGKYLIFRLLALDPAVGFAVGLIRRLREIAWSTLGFVVLAWWQRQPDAHEARSGRDRAEAAGAGKA